MSRDWGEKLTEAIPVLTLGAGLLALFLGVSNWWVIFVVGWVVLTPLSEILFDVDEESESTLEPPAPPAPSEWGDSEVEPPDADRGESTQDALETLRERYATGELTEEQFERKVEKLLQTETVEDARDRVADAAERSSERAAETGRERAAGNERERETDREREPER